MAKDIDQKITELFAVLQKQKDEVEKTEKESKKSWLTNGLFKLDGHDPFNIQMATEEKLKKALTHLLIFKDYSGKAEAILGLESDTKFAGYTAEEWQHDFLVRIAKINLITRKEKLKELDKRLSVIISPEQKRQMELDAITKDLGIK